MEDAVGYLVVLLSGLALLNVGAAVLGKALKMGMRPVLRDAESRALLLTGTAGLAGLILCAAAAGLFYQLVGAVLNP